MSVDQPTESDRPAHLRGANVVAMTFDLLGAIILALYGIILGPLGVLRGPIVLERAIWYLWVLLPQGLMARSIRTALDWRMGHFDSAIAQLEGLVGSSEEYYKDRVTSRMRRRVLEDLYTVLCRAYLHAGHIDDAMLVIIRAKKCMAIDRLPGLAELDAKTAHLVRAGLAAGRLLDGGGLATMFVKSTQTTPSPGVIRKRPQPQPQPPSPANAAHSNSQSKGETKAHPQLQGASAKATQPQAAMAKTSDDGAKIIPFPSPRRELT